MSGKAKPIPPKAAALWAAGDEAGAAKLAHLQPRQLRNRLGPPGRGKLSPSPAPAVEPAVVPEPQKLVRGAPAPGRGAPPAPSSPPDSEPSAADIEAVDTLDEARKVLHEIRTKMTTADEVRFASLAEKALSAINRIEQIEARRPRAPARDEVTARLVAIRDAAICRAGVLTSDEALRFEAAASTHEAWLLETLGPHLGAEARRRFLLVVDGPPVATDGGPTS